MTLIDYALDLGLLALVILQVRGRRLTARSLLLPLAVVAWAGVHYLHTVPTGGNDLLLVGLGLMAGSALGVGAGLTTKVVAGPDGNGVVAKAGLAAAALWILGVGSCFAFQLYVTHGGEPAIARFSASHYITSGEAWAACLLLMALAEVMLRTAIIAWRARPFGLLGPAGRPAPARVWSQAAPVSPARVWSQAAEVRGPLGLGNVHDGGR